MRLSGSRTRTIVSRLSVFVLAVAAAGALGTATANASTGGGCLTKDGYSACISASGSSLEPDYYSLVDNGCIGIEVQVLDANGGKLMWEHNAGSAGCTVGKHGPWAVNSGNSSVVNGGSYITVVSNEDGSVAVSPSETLSY